jgi:hypothetical protein
VPTSEVLNALATVGRRREQLDRAEWLLVAAARLEGATWADVATALGLRSRQAAEQRWLRLLGAVGLGAGASAAVLGRRDPNVTRALRDPAPASADVAQVRAHVALLYDLLVQMPATPALRLARETLAVAGPAPAGALHDLVRLALDDLRGVSAAPAVERTCQSLRQALDASSTATIS